MTKVVGKEAVVIGASMGGLLAARALADCFEQVTILERDTFGATAEHRKGVPQSKHTHGLLARGREIMEDYFPGLTNELIAIGGVYCDMLDDCRWFNEGVYHNKFKSGLGGVLVSRLALEYQVRTRLLALPNVKLIPNCDVLGLVASENKSRILGVRYRLRQDSSPEVVYNADLVVDSTGRGSRTPAWLRDYGYDIPEEENIKVNLGYTTRQYRRRPGDMNGWFGLVLSPTVANPRFGVILAQEEDRWIVSLGGYLGDHAPTDPADFLEFARTLPNQDIYEVISKAEPLSEPLPYKYASSQRRYYEKLKRFPAGFLVIGDAICSFNPAYGQGMTVAAQESVVLMESVSAGLDSSLYKRFFKAAGKVVTIPWSITAGSDLRFPQVQGKRTLMVRFINWYIGKLHMAAKDDPAVALAFQKVTNLMAPPPSLMKLPIAMKVWRGNRRAAKQAEKLVIAPDVR